MFVAVAVSGNGCMVRNADVCEGECPAAELPRSVVQC